MTDSKKRETERARLQYQAIEACNQIVLSPCFTQEEREDALASIAAFAQARLEQCLANPKEAGFRIDSALEPETKEPPDDDLSFLE